MDLDGIGLGPKPNLKYV